MNRAVEHAHKHKTSTHTTSKRITDSAVVTVSGRLFAATEFDGKFFVDCLDCEENIEWVVVPLNMPTRTTDCLIVLIDFASERPNLDVVVVDSLSMRGNAEAWAKMVGDYALLSHPWLFEEATPAVAGLDAVMEPELPVEDHSHLTELDNDTLTDLAVECGEEQGDECSVFGVHGEVARSSQRQSDTPRLFHGSGSPLDLLFVEQPTRTEQHPIDRAAPWNEHGELKPVTQLGTSDRTHLARSERLGQASLDACDFTPPLCQCDAALSETTEHQVARESNSTSQGEQPWARTSSTINRAIERANTMKNNTSSFAWVESLCEQHLPPELRQRSRYTPKRATTLVRVLDISPSDFARQLRQLARSAEAVLASYATRNIWSPRQWRTIMWLCGEESPLG